jgi:RHS repeat-associated protein
VDTSGSGAGGGGGGGGGGSGARLADPLGSGLLGQGATAGGTAGTTVSSGAAAPVAALAAPAGAAAASPTPAAPGAGQPARPGAATTPSPSLVTSFGQSAMAFEINQGQADPSVRVLSRGAGVGFWLTQDQMVFAVSRPAQDQGHGRAPLSPGRDVFRLSLEGASPQAIVDGTDLLNARSNYFVGADPARWQADVPQYGSVTYRDVWPGVDLVLHSQQAKTFEYDFTLAPGASPDAVKLRWEGLQSISVDPQGRMHLLTGGGEVVQEVPTAFQEDQGVRHAVSVSPVLGPGGEVSFRLEGPYDPTRPVTIDPVIGFSSYLGGTSFDNAYAVAADAAGDVYVAGQSNSSNYPTQNGFDPTANGGADVVVTKLNAAGSELVYSTYVGSSGDDLAYGLAVGPDGDAYVTGFAAAGFPTTAGAYQTTASATANPFVLRLTQAGDALYYSTYLAGNASGNGYGVAVDALGSAYVAGWTSATNFPVVGGFQGSSGGGEDAFVTKLQPDGKGLVYSTYLGGGGTDEARGIAIDASENAFVTGYTTSTSPTSFPTTAGALSTARSGNQDAFVTKVDATGGSKVYSTYLGGSGSETGTAVAVGTDGRPWLTGTTNSTNYPTTGGAYQATNAGGSDVYVTQLNAAGSAVSASTYLGSSSTDVGWGIGVDSQGRPTVAGYTSYTNFPTSGAFQASSGGLDDAFITRLTATAGMSYSSYFGGSSNDHAEAVALDPRGDAYMAGYTGSSTLPGTSGSFQPSYDGATDGFVTKVEARPAAPVITGISSDTGYLASDEITTDQTLTIRGTAGANVTVTLERAGVGTLGSVQANGAGAWTYDYTGTTLPEGTYDFVARALDGTGTKSDYSATEFLVTVDRTAPDVYLYAPATTPSRGPEVRVVARDLIGLPAGATVTLDVDKNNNGSFADAGETGYATGNLVDGQVTIKLPALAGTGTYPIRARVTDLAGNQGTSATTSVVVSSVASPWVATADVLTADPLTGDWQTQLGDVSVSHPLDLDQSPGTGQGGDPALVYHSSSVSQKPIVQVTLPSANNIALPDTLTAGLTFNGTQAGTVTYSVSPTGFAPGDVFTIALQASSTITTTGRYGYSVLVQVPGQADQTVTGSAFVVAQDSSPLGAGWTLAGVDRLVIIAADGTGPAGVLRVYGTGGYRFYQGTGPFTSPAGDSGTLSLSGGTYTYQTPDGQTWTFNGSGYMTQWASADGKETRGYRYDGSNRLSGVTAIDGGVTTISYSAGSVAIQTVNGRTTTLSIDGSGNLSAVTNPDGGVHTFTYDGSHRLTREQYGPSLENNWAYTGAGVLGTFTWGAVGSAPSSQSTYKPAVTRGLAALAALVSGTVLASATDPLGHTDSWQLDDRGQPLQHLAPNGALTRWGYSGGYVASETDPLGRATTYTRDAQGYVTQETLPDGSLITYQYQSAFHALTTMVNELGNATTYAYDSGGHQTRTTDALGDVTTSSYDAATGLLQSTTDARGGTTTYSYDGNRRLTQTTDALSHSTAYGYDANGNPQTTTDALGRVTTTGYDVMGRLASSVDALGNRTTTSYDAAGLEQATTDALNVQSSSLYESGKRGLVASTVQSLNGAASGLQLSSLSTYDAAGRAVQSRNQSGWSATTTYDANGQATGSTDALSGGTVSVTDLAGQVIAARDQLGRWTFNSYDARGRQIQVKDNLGNLTTTAYDRAGNVTASTDAQGRTTTSVYDALNQQTVSIDPLGRRTTTSYDAAGNVSTVTDPLNHVTSYAYDALNRRTQETDAVGTSVQRTRQTSYDQVGNVKTTTDGLGNVTTQLYDALNRPTETIDPRGQHTTTSYDAAGDVTTVKDALGKVVTYSYDSLHRQLAVQDQLSHTTTTVLDGVGSTAAGIDALSNVSVAGKDPLEREVVGVDAQGAVTQTVLDGSGGTRMIVDPGGNEWHYVVDGLGGETVRIDPAGNATTTAYDAVGRVTSVTDRDGRLIQYSYDNGDRLTSAVWKSAAGATVNLLTYTYDNANNLLTAADYNGALTYTYDELNRVKTYTNVFGQQLTYSYDAEDRATLRQDSLGGVQTSVYNAVGMLTSRQFGGAGQTPVRVDFGYTNLDQQSTITRYSDLAGTTVVGTSVYSYDDTGHLTGIVNKNNSSATLSYYTYTYDSADRVSAQTHWSQVGTVVYSGTNTYTYDATSQLTNDGTTAYSYDANGNRTMAGYQTGVANRLTNDGTYTYTYDAEGNLTQKSKGAGQETWYYTYDNGNRLTNIRKTSDGTTNTLLLTYTYDVQGNRVKEQTWGSSSPAETRFAYDGDDVLADLDSSNTVQVRRLFGDGSDQVLSRTVASGDNAGLWFYQTDNLGSVRDLVNSSSQVKAHLDYDGFGVRTDPQASVSDRYGYTGREWQSDAGLQYNRARWYVPSLGRWLSEDSEQFDAGDRNLYRYV